MDRPGPWIGSTAVGPGSVSPISGWVDCISIDILEVAAVQGRIKNLCKEF